MIEQILKEEELFIIREIESDPSSTQRVLSEKLGISLGKINYLLKELIKKGFIKAKSFSNNSGKLEKLNYLITKKGFEKRMELTYHFLKRKEDEYNQIKRQWQDLKKCKNQK